MKLTFEKRQDQKGSALLSIGLHVILIALIASITFTYPIGSLFETRDIVPAERITYVKVQPQAPAGGGSSTVTNSTKAKPKKKADETPVLPSAPIVTPSQLPPVPPPTASSGTGNGLGSGSGSGVGAGIASGVAPAMPDSRIALQPSTLRLPLTVAQRNDSAVKAIYMAYRAAEIEAAAHEGRNPRDWTFEKGGQKYGIDSSYIYLGKFKLPSAILAALPFNYGGVDGRRIIEGRNASWIQNDIYTHSQGLSEDDFRAAIRRIRERTDREKKAQDDAKKSPGIVP